MSPLKNAEDGPCGNQMGAKFGQDGPVDTVQDRQRGPSTADEAQLHDFTEQQRKRARTAAAAPAVSDAANVLLASAAAAGQQVASQQQDTAAPPAAAPPAAASAPPAAAVADNAHVLQRQAQQPTSPSPSTAGAAAAAQPGQFPVGMQLRLWEQEGTLWRRKFTDTMYEVTCKGFIGEGGNAEAHLVQLDNVQLCTQPATAAADNSEGRMAAAAAVAAAPQAAAAAACRTGNQPLRSPEVGGLYVLKLCRQLQDLTAEERGNVAVDDMRSYRNAARKQLLGVRARYGRLAGSPRFVRCFAYGTAQVVVPGAAAAPPRSKQERPCLLLEYAQGGSVAALLQSPEGGPAGMSEQHAFEVMRAAAAALQECHRKRIIYRSVHPGNIVKAQAPSGREVFKMINCGSSTTMDEGLGSGYRFGMWAYRAPEQRAGVYHHYTLDTWHLGCLLLHLRTGELPLPELLGLPGEEWLAKVSAVHSDIMHCEQHPYLQRYSSLSLQERELLSKCLIPDANERPMVERVYDSCNYFAREGLALGGDALLNLASHLASAVARRLVGELYGNNQQGEV